MTLAAWAGVTEHVTLGHMVTANPLRSPALLAKSVDARPHERRPRDPGHRCRLERRRVRVIRRRARLVDGGADRLAGRGGRPDAGHVRRAGGHGRAAYTSRAVRNILRRSNAAYRSSSAGRASARRCGRSPGTRICGRPSVDVVREAESTLRRWCDEVGRDPAEMRYVFSAEASVLRDSEAEAARVAQEIGRKNGAGRVRRRGPRRGWPRSWHPTRSSGSAVLPGYAPPFDDETLVRFIGEVARCSSRSAQDRWPPEVTSGVPASGFANPDSTFPDC